MEQRQTLRIDNARERIEKRIINCNNKNRRKLLIKVYDSLGEYQNNDPRELKLCLEKIIIESSYPRERQKFFAVLNVLYSEKTRSNQETSNNEWLRLTLNEHFTKKDPGEKFYLIINRNNFIHKKNFTPIIKKIFENMKTSGLTSIYEKENFSMIKNKEYYDNCSNKKKLFLR